MPDTAIPVNFHRYFATTVALVTTDGESGPNVMAAEWAMQISYEPMLIAIFIHDSPTLWNIRQTGAFGVHIAADDQAPLVNIAGGYSGTEMAKLTIPGTFLTYSGTSVPLLRGCTLTCECKVVSVQEIGDHVMVVGKALSATFDEKKSPLIYTRGNYRRIGGKIASDRKTVRLPAKPFHEFMHLAGGQFVLKMAAALVRDGKRTLFARIGDSSWILPVTVPEKGMDYKKALSTHLESLGVQAQINQILGIERLSLRSAGDKRTLRANLVIFACTAHASDVNRKEIEWFTHPPRNVLLRDLLLFEQA